MTGGAFGPGWSSLLDAGVTVAANGLTAVVRSADGQQLVYTSNGHGGWNPPPGARATLSCQLPLCTVTRFDGVSFQSIGGKIQNYLSPNGIGLHFIYTAGHLSQITGSAEALALGMQASLGEEIGTLAWSGQSSGTTQNLNALAVIDSKHVWAVGANCTLEMTTNGSTWTKDTNVTGCAPGTSLTAIAANSGDGPDWAVGTAGRSSSAPRAAAPRARPGRRSPGPARLPRPSTSPRCGSRTEPRLRRRHDGDRCGPALGLLEQLQVVDERAGRRGVGQRDTRRPHGHEPQRGGGPGRRTRARCRLERHDPRLLGQLLDEPRRVVEACLGSRRLGAGERDHVQLGVGRRRQRRLCGRLRSDLGLLGQVQQPDDRERRDELGLEERHATGSWLAVLTSVSTQNSEVWAAGANGQIWYCPTSCSTEATGWVSIGAPGGPNALGGIDAVDHDHAWAVEPAGRSST